MLSISKDGKVVEVELIRGKYLDAQRLAELGVIVYDPALMNTAIAESGVSRVDGEKGELLYRGYPIEDLAEKASFMEVAFLLLNGELPNRSQLDNWTRRINEHTVLHTDMLEMMRKYRFDAHPMGMLISTTAAMATMWPEFNPALHGEGIYADAQLRNKLIARVLGKLPTIAAACYRHRMGRVYNQPNGKMDLVENFLYMLDAYDADYRPHPKLVRIMEVLFILHADHSTNCSTAAMRHMTSAATDPITGVAAAMSALYGPRHGGANEAVVRMLQRIGSVDAVPAFIEGVKARKEKLVGFGHRVYRRPDPRANVIRKLADEVFELTGRSPLIDIALELERIALADDFFIKRRLFPNVDFFSGVLYFSLGLPLDFFPVMFALPRAVGWLAHWNEMQLQKGGFKIMRPKQIYIGKERRDFVELDKRPMAVAIPDQSIYYSNSHRRHIISTEGPIQMQQRSFL